MKRRDLLGFTAGVSGLSLMSTGAMTRGGNAPAAAPAGGNDEKAL